MTNPPGFEGIIDIELFLDEGATQPSQVAIRSSRPTDISRIFQGKSVDETLQLIPLVFSVCSRAQQCASVRAIEKAQGITVQPHVETIRESLVHMETISEHLWRVFLNWPNEIGEPENHSLLARVKRIAGEYETHLCGNYNYFAPGALPQRHLGNEHALHSSVNQIIEIVESNILQCEISAWLEIFGTYEFQQWLQKNNTPAKSFIQHIVANNWQTAGRCDSKVLSINGEEDEAQLHREMENEDFTRHPSWQGACRETSSGARVDSPLLYALKKEYGNGLLVRVIARLTELVMLTQHLIPGRVAAETTMGQVPDINLAIGKVNAARGQLLHRVELQGNYIKRYQILAPTEWNFHPQGVVALALASLKGSRDQIVQQAKLLIEIIDPCVGYRLHTQEMEHTNA